MSLVEIYISYFISRCNKPALCIAKRPPDASLYHVKKIILMFLAQKTYRIARLKYSSSKFDFIIPLQSKFPPSRYSDTTQKKSPN